MVGGGGEQRRREGGREGETELLDFNVLLSTTLRYLRTTRERERQTDTDRQTDRDTQRQRKFRGKRKNKTNECRRHKIFLRFLCKHFGGRPSDVSIRQSPGIRKGCRHISNLDCKRISPEWLGKSD